MSTKQTLIIFIISLIVIITNLIWKVVCGCRMDRDFACNFRMKCYNTCIVEQGQANMR